MPSLTSGVSLIFFCKTRLLPEQAQSNNVCETQFEVDYRTVSAALPLIRNLHWPTCHILRNHRINQIAVVNTFNCFLDGSPGFWKEILLLSVANRSSSNIFIFAIVRRFHFVAQCNVLKLERQKKRAVIAASGL